eukprot:TRINITY_DN2434_c0_g2_i1.p1 TRINITY_DN2434_c0_g2~~TRINITY_DN2434_c0_g2_i1.p1  ORF type:complete len:324 (+),score=67.98 TRINITY_DN2434_c0_g2_i1:36-974(+)
MTSQEVYFILKGGEPYTKRIRFEFEIEFSHERALLELETFETIIDRYFDVMIHQDRGRKRKRSIIDQEQQQRTKKEHKSYSSFFEGSVIIDDENIEEKERQREREILVQWLIEEREAVEEKERISKEKPKKHKRDKEEEKKGECLKTSLLFRGSRDGFTAQAFHRKADSKGPTLVLFRTSEGKRAGGYAHAAWRSDYEFIEDPDEKSFLFSLDHRTKHKLKSIATNSSSGGGRASRGLAGFVKGSNIATKGLPGFGPMFGDGDLVLASNCHINRNSYSNVSQYLLPNNSHLVGVPFFQISDYEVWQIHTEHD